jgi:hypothetical protein
MRLLSADWRRRPSIATAPVPLAGRLQRDKHSELID